MEEEKDSTCIKTRLSCLYKHHPKLRSHAILYIKLQGRGGWFWAAFTDIFTTQSFFFQGFTYSPYTKIRLWSLALVGRCSWTSYSPTSNLFSVILQDNRLFLKKGRDLMCLYHGDVLKDYGGTLIRLFDAWTCLANSYWIWGNSKKWLFYGRS